MAKDDQPVSDLHPVAWAPITDVPAEMPLHRLDYGDADQRAEMDGIDDKSPGEPVELVDAPIQLRKPFSQPEKRRNQRRMPT